MKISLHSDVEAPEGKEGVPRLVWRKGGGLEEVTKKGVDKYYNMVNAANFEDKIG